MKHTVVAVVAALAAMGAAGSLPQDQPASPPGALAELVGRIEVIPPKRGRGSATSGSVVWLPGVEARAAAPRPTVTSQNKRFTPRVLAVPAGTSVDFPNQDPIYHNAFSLTPGNSFDLGLYRRGASKSVTLREAGVVRVYCNIHPGMAAYVLVVEGRAYAVAARDGSYRIPGIPPGRHLVKVWNEMADELEITLDFRPGERTEWSPTVDASRFRRRPHKNKYGRDYPPATSDVDRY